MEKVKEMSKFKPPVVKQSQRRKYNIQHIVSDVVATMYSAMGTRLIAVITL